MDQEVTNRIPKESTTILNDLDGPKGEYGVGVRNLRGDMKV